MSTINGVISNSGGLTGTLTLGGGSANLQDNKNVSPALTEQVVLPDEGYDGLAKVTVEAVPLQDKTVTLGSSQQVISADTGYTGLGEVTVPGVSLQDKTVTLSSVQQVITADSGYTGLGEVTVPASSGSVHNYMDEILNNNPSDATPVAVSMADAGDHKCFGFSGGFSLTLPNTVTKVMDNAFADVRTLNSVTGQTVTEVQNSAFYGCSNLTAVSFNNLYSIGTYAFSYTGLTSITLNTLGGNGISEGAFLGCGSLTYVKLGTVQSLPDSCFEGCQQLTDLHLGWSGNPVSLGANVFNGVIDLTVHVRSAKLADYQADTDWQAAIAQAQQDGNSITLVGDYS